MNLADFIGFARVEQYPLGGRGFAGVDMRHYADIPRVLNRIFSWHKSRSP
jgi:hypothetical protein